MDEQTREYFDSMRRELARYFEAIDQRFNAVDQRFDTVEQRITAEAEETRRHFGVIAESLRNDIKLLVDGLETNRREVAVLREDMHAEFRARDAVLHAAFLEVRRDIAELRQGS